MQKINQQKINSALNRQFHSSQQDVRLSDKRILPYAPGSLRDLAKHSEVAFCKAINHEQSRRKS